MLDRLKNIFGTASAPAAARPRVRLAIVQGPQQFLAATAAIRHECAVEGTAQVPSIAVIGYFYSTPAENAKMRAACQEIAHHCGYAQTIDAAEIEQALRGRKLSFAAAVRRLREKLGGVVVETVYVARNGQSLNELGLAAAGESARRIAYGDGLGWVDLENSWGERVYNPQGYAPISEAWLTMPVEYQPGLFDRLRIVVVPTHYYAEIVSSLCERVAALGELRRHFRALSRGAPVTLCLTGQMTESCMTATVEDELALYETTARPLLSRGESVVIKGHPRAFSGQSRKFAERLRSWGVCAEFSEVELPWPAEFLSQFLTLDRVLSFCSTTGIMLAWFQRRPTQVGLDPEAMRRHLPPERVKSWSRDFQLIKLLVRQAYAGQFVPTRYDDAENPAFGFEDGSQILEADGVNVSAMKTA